MKISIIIPAFNVEQFLPKCLDSIFCQKGVTFEVIVVNDGCTDGTQAILEQYASQWQNLKVITQENRGMSTARNRGLVEALGEYVMFVDSDDWVIEDSLASVEKSLTGEDIISFNSRKFIERTGEYIDNILPEISEPISGWEYFNRQRLSPTVIHFVCIWQRAYRREFLIQNNLIFADGILRAEDDLFSTMAMYFAKSVKVIPEAVYTYRIRNNSITTTVSIDRWYDSLKVQEIMADFFVNQKGIDKSAIYRVLSSGYIGWFSGAIIKLYGNHDKELRNRINWKYFKEVSTTKRHKRLYHLIRISPSLFRGYVNLASIIKG